MQFPALPSIRHASAQGQVQHLKYSATFPLLLNVSDRPTYFISLKDDAGLVKMYAFVDVEQYQIVGTGQTIDEARKNYRTALNLEDVETGGSMDTLEKTGTVDAVAVWSFPAIPAITLLLREIPRYTPPL